MTGPPDERSGPPSQERPARKDIDRDADPRMVSTAADFSSRDVLLAEIYALGSDQLYAASLGWRLGLLDAEEIAKQRIAQAGRDMANSPEWRALCRRPTWPELQRRRGECTGRRRIEQCTCSLPKDDA